MNTNILDLNDDILNIIGDYVKKDNLERKIIKDNLLKEYKQNINGKNLKFYPLYHWSVIFDINNYAIKDGDTISKDNTKRYLFNQINRDIKYIKEHARVDGIKLTRQDLRMCIWVCFQRYKLPLDDHKIYLNMEDENNYFDEYLTFKKLNLKTKKYSFNY